MQTWLQTNKSDLAALKYFASLGCAVRWSGFNCPWDTLTFTWLKVTLCRAGPVGGGITLGGAWKASSEHPSRPRVYMCLCVSLHTYVIRQIACESMLRKYVFHCISVMHAVPKAYTQTHVTVSGNLRDNSITGMGWDLLFPLWTANLSLSGCKLPLLHVESFSVPWV